MNKRILELIESSGLKLKERRPYRDDEPDGYVESDNDFIDNNWSAVQKFLNDGAIELAQMIIEECSNLTENCSNRFTDETGAERIREYFGVE